MATDDRKFGINPVAAALMAGGDAISGIYGQRGNTYATYLDAQTKRQAMEAEAQKALQVQAMDAYQKQQDSITKYAGYGMRPIDPAQAMSASGRMPSKMVPGAYGQSYVPDPNMRKAAGGIPRFTQDAEGNLIPAPGIIVETPQQKLQRSIDTASGKKDVLGAGAESGRLQLSQDAVRDVQSMKKILFPDGTAESFKRSSALKSNIFGKPVPNSEAGQDLYRLGRNAIAGKQLIQTGVAARPEETKQLIDSFLANVFSNPKSAYKALDELESFYSGYQSKADPEGKFTSGKKSGSKPAKDSLGLFE